MKILVETPCMCYVISLKDHVCTVLSHWNTLFVPCYFIETPMYHVISLKHPVYSVLSHWNTLYVPCYPIETPCICYVISLKCLVCTVLSDWNTLYVPWYLKKHLVCTMLPHWNTLYILCYLIETPCMYCVILMKKLNTLGLFLYVHLWTGISMEALCNSASRLDDPTVQHCLKALKALLSSEWPRSQLGRDAVLCRELLNVMHR